MSRILATDLNDRLLANYTALYLADAESWILETALASGVAEADVLPTLPARAKRAAVYQLAILVCLGEGGQNQQAFSGEGKDAFAVKLKQYQDQLDKLLPELTAADWSGSTEPEDATPANISPRLYRA